ncbi:MAG: nuclear transport factor 2 family protein [Candidatus Heimdallarchaeota archaeon]
MSDQIEQVKHFIQAMEESNIKKVDSFLSEKFVFEGPVPQPLNKENYIGFLHAMSNAFTEFKYNPSNFSEEGNTVTYAIKITGKHTGKLALPNINPIPATNRTFELPPEKATITFSGDKISKMYANVTENGGVGGIIKQLTA